MSADSLPNLRRCANEACCEPSTGRLKATVLDTLTLRHTLFAAGAFFFCVFLTLIIGGTGPAVANNRAFVVSAPSDSTLRLNFVLGGLSKWQQATWLVASLQRPVTAEGGPYLQLAQPLTMPVTWTLLAVTADGVRTLVNSSHITNVNCPPQQATCSGFAVFSQALTGVAEYNVEVLMANPYAGFNLPAQAVVLNMNQGSVNPLYTQFEAGFKVFYCVFSILIWLFFMWQLRRGQGTHDSEGVALASTHEQKWLMYLGFALFWFNDPNFITYLAYPTPAGAGFSAFCAATFVALLLFFFLALADNARQGGDAGFSFHHDHALRAKGACFWVPKVLLCSIIWATSLALYVFQRLSNLQDPSFTFADTFGQFYMTVLVNFVIGMGVLYILYLLVLLVLAFRAFRTASPSSRFLLALSATTLLLTLVGLFSQGFVATRSTTIAFLAAYGVPTVYVWALMLLLRPAPHPPSWAANTQGAFASSTGPGGAAGALQALPPPPPAAALSSQEWGALDAAAQLDAFRQLQEYALAAAGASAAAAAAAAAAAGAGAGAGAVAAGAGQGVVGSDGSSGSSTSGFGNLEAAESGQAKGGQGRAHAAAHGALPNAVEAEEVEVEGVEGGQGGSKWT